MNPTLMVLPAKDSKEIRVISVPNDFEEHEAFRHVTGLIASVEEENANYSWDDIIEVLEDHGFEAMPFTLGPALD